MHQHQHQPQPHQQHQQRLGSVEAPLPLAGSHRTSRATDQKCHLRRPSNAACGTKGSSARTGPRTVLGPPGRRDRDRDRTTGSWFRIWGTPTLVVLAFAFALAPGLALALVAAMLDPARGLVVLRLHYYLPRLHLHLHFHCCPLEWIGICLPAFWLPLRQRQSTERLSWAFVRFRMGDGTRGQRQKKHHHRRRGVLRPGPGPGPGPCLRPRGAKTRRRCCGSGTKAGRTTTRRRASIFRPVP
mmetsp:Transcript_3691/g.10441  ORF Transcript_3691/g.10441 Transcript_3691/m.10441 type:complete len:242 (-) Transcript_3691:1272-1997(-)